jgi:hypothetical protein
LNTCSPSLHLREAVPAAATTKIVGCKRERSPFTPIHSRPRVARGFRRSRQITVLHQCIRPLLGACAPGHHGYQRAYDLISGQASTGPLGPPVFACAGKTDPPWSSHPLAGPRRAREELPTSGYPARSVISAFPNSDSTRRLAKLDTALRVSVHQSLYFGVLVEPVVCSLSGRPGGWAEAPALS